MNRLAIHESSAPDLSPTELVDIARQTGFDSVGLKVAHSPGADRWWRKGAGSAELRTMVEHLLISRVSVLDIGRVELGDDTETSYRAVLDLAERLGTRYVTASGMPTSQRPDAGRRATGDTWGRLVADCENYQLIPLLVAVPGTTVSTTDQALASPERSAASCAHRVDRPVGLRDRVPGAGSRQPARLPSAARR